MKKLFLSRFGIMSLLFVSGCMDSNQPKDIVPTDNSPPISYIIPNSCHGAVGLDWSANYNTMVSPYRVMTPHNLAVQSKQRKYLAGEYFSGAFQTRYEEIVRLTSKSAAQNWPDQKPLERLFGNIVPIAYMAMCMEDLEALEWAKEQTFAVKAILEKSTDRKSPLSYRLVRYTDLLLWEYQLAHARLTNSHGELLDLKEGLRVYQMSYRSSGSGRQYLLPKSEMPFSDQKKSGLFLPKIDQAKYELLIVELYTLIAIHDDNINLLEAAGRVLEYLDFGFAPDAKPNIRISTGYVYDGPPYALGYYTRAMVYTKWLELIDLTIYSESLRQKQKPKPVIKDYYDRDERKKLQQHIDLDPGMFGLGYHILYSKSRQWLLYENAPFLWALRHELHARIHIDMMTAPPSKNMVGERKPPTSTNSSGHCHAYQSLLLARQIIPSIEMSEEQKTWCDEMPVPYGGEPNVKAAVVPPE